MNGAPISGAPEVSFRRTRHISHAAAILFSLLVPGCSPEITPDTEDVLAPRAQVRLLPDWVTDRPGAPSNPYFAATAYRDACFPPELPIMYHPEALRFAPDIFMFDVWTHFSSEVYDRTERIREGLSSDPVLAGRPQEITDALDEILTLKWYFLESPTWLDKSFIADGLHDFLNREPPDPEAFPEFERQLRDALLAVLEPISRDPIHFLAAADTICSAQGHLAGRRPFQPLTSLQASMTYDPVSETWLADRAAFYLCRECNDAGDASPGRACFIDKRDVLERLGPRMVPVLAMEPERASEMAGKLVIRAAFVPVIDPESFEIKLNLLRDDLAVQNICSGEILSRFPIAD